MDRVLVALLDELARFGEENDAIGEKLHRALVIGAPAFGEAYAPRGAVQQARQRITAALHLDETVEQTSQQELQRICHL